MLKIGEFSKLSRVSVRMLRHYDEIGLLPPASIDSATGYRYYSEDQLPVAGRITALRDIGFGLGEIQACQQGRENPQVLAADEITAPEDVAALRTACGCGVTLLATAHGEGRGDLERRALYRPLLEDRCFRRLVRIVRDEAGRHYQVEELG